MRTPTRPTGMMLDFINAKLGYEQAKRRIESVRSADQVRQAVAIAIVYRSLGGV